MPGFLKLLLSAISLFVCACAHACVCVCPRPQDYKLRIHSCDIEPVQPIEQVCCV